MAFRSSTIPGCAPSAKHSRTPVQTDKQLRDLIANYYGMISLVDHNVGRILAALDTYGLSRRHAGRLFDRPWRLAGRSRADPQGADGL